MARSSDWPAVQMLPDYIDIHTHRLNADREGVFAVRSYHAGFGQVGQGQYCSMGLHPWYLQNAQVDMELLAKKALQPNVLAIGECGLDRVCDTDWALQVDYFKLQILLANRLQKPIVVHCVRAFNEVSELLVQCHNKVPVIFHGFNKKWLVAWPLIGNGAYLSFGAALMRAHLPASAVLASIPAERFFLETDDSLVPIEDIYVRAAQIRNTGVEEIILQVQKNFKAVFKI